VLDSARLWQLQGVERTDVMLAVASLERATKLVNANMEALLKPHNITFTRFSVLTRLYWTESGSLTLGEIANLLMVHPTSVTSAIDRLERDGMVARVSHPSDRRAMLAQITEAGRTLVKKATPELIDARFGFAGVDAKTCGELALVLRRVRAGAGETVGDEKAYRHVIAGRPLDD
jgi:DNA-binding MarR family transcriptional regulator